MDTLPDLTFYRTLATLASSAALEHFRGNTLVDNKLARGFDPVTEADRSVETVLRDIIGKAFPDHGIVGEEHENIVGAGRFDWVIDPVDGTRAFISGLPVWGVLVGLLDAGRAISGMMCQPYTGELYCGDANGAWLVERDGKTRAIRTRKGVDLADAIAFTTDPHLYRGDDVARFSRLRDCLKLCRYGCDCYGAAMVASGHADIWIEPGLAPYDVCGLIALVEQAGGVITRWDGGRPEAGGNIVATGSQALHEAVLARLDV